MKIGFVFTGQGSQKVGMGKDFQTHPLAKKVYEEINEALGYDLVSLAFEGDASQLKLTSHAQPAIMMVSMAGYRIFEERMGSSLAPQFFGGHSLGEYTALVASGSLNLSDAARLLRVRGEAMQEAVPHGIGGMAAIIGLQREQIKHLCDSLNTDDGIVTIANDNSDGQIVVSGHQKQVQQLADAAKKAGAKRAILLEVSAPFHCALMKPAAAKMEEALSSVTLRQPLAPILTNVTADYVSDPQQLKSLLVRQVTERVRWREMMERMEQDGLDIMLEWGPANVLANLARRSSHSFQSHAITDLASLEDGLALLP